MFSPLQKLTAYSISASSLMIRFRAALVFPILASRYIRSGVIPRSSHSSNQLFSFYFIVHVALDIVLKHQFHLRISILNVMNICIDWSILVFYHWNPVSFQFRLFYYRNNWCTIINNLPNASCIGYWSEVCKKERSFCGA